MAKRSDNPRISFSHSKRLLWIIIILIILLVALIYFLTKNNKNSDKSNTNQVNNSISSECRLDTDCVPASCCHPNSCVTVDKKPECNRRLCSMDCSGPLDCGAGYCGCVNGKCSIVNGR